MKNFIKKCLEKKYQNIIYNKEQTFNIFKIKKKLIQKYYIKNIFLKKKNYSQNKKNIITYEYLYYLAQKKITKKDLKKIFIFYKKFSTNLYLKKKYDFKLKKITNINTNIETYVLLGYLSSKIHQLNNLQKLNILLKINELVLLNINKIRNINILNIYAHNLYREIKIIKKYI